MQLNEMNKAELDRTHGIITRIVCASQSPTLCTSPNLQRIEMEAVLRKGVEEGVQLMWEDERFRRLEGLKNEIKLHYRRRSDPEGVAYAAEKRAEKFHSFK
jgi:hypothetical protein